MLGNDHIVPAERRLNDRPPEWDFACPEEPAVIRAALAECGGNVARAARRLGVPRGTLRYRIRKYGLDHLIPKD